LASFSELTPRKRKLYEHIYGTRRVCFMNSKRSTRQRS
jgi:hypothetical protein